MVNDFLERGGHMERIDHRSYERQGIDQIPTVHVGVSASQMEKKGIVTERGELNRNIQKTNRLIREIRVQIGNLKEWIAELFRARETAPENPQPPQSPDLANLLMRYLSVQREGSRKYSQGWQQRHAAEKRMKELQNLIQYGKNYFEYMPVHNKLKTLKNGWTNKRDKYEETHRTELALWNAANRYLHANLPLGMKSFSIAEWEKEYAGLKAQRGAKYAKLKETRAEVAELQNIRKCVEIAQRADQPRQTQARSRRYDIDR